MRGYQELEEVNNELRLKNIDYVAKIKEMILHQEQNDKQERELNEVKEMNEKIKVERSSCQDELEKLRISTKKKIDQLQERHETDKRLLQ